MTLRVLPQDDVPRPVYVLGVLFFLGGVVSVLHILVGAFILHINLDFGVLSLWIGPGLIRGERRWWTWARVFTWISAIATPLALLIVFGGRVQPTWSILDIPIAAAHPAALIAAAVLWEAVAVWGLWVLHRYSSFVERDLAAHAT